MRTRRGKLYLLLAIISAIAFVAFASHFDSVTHAQRKRSSSQSTTKMPSAKPAPSPASPYDAIGAAPPVPRLKQKPPEKEQDINPGDVISVTTTEIMLPVTVRDNNGRLIS